MLIEFVRLGQRRVGKLRNRGNHMGWESLGCFSGWVKAACVATIPISPFFVVF